VLISLVLTHRKVLARSHTFCGHPHKSLAVHDLSCCPFTTRVGRQSQRRFCSLRLTKRLAPLGYFTDASRATLVVSGPVANGQGHTTAVDGTCPNCSGVTLRNIQVSTFKFALRFGYLVPHLHFRSMAPVSVHLQLVRGGPNIEMGARIRTS
jgi:hypothetical protein